MLSSWRVTATFRCFLACCREPPVHVPFSHTVCRAPQVEAAQALGIGVLEALAAGGAPAHLAQRVATAVALARHAAAAADASLLRCSVAAPAAAGGAGPESTALQQVRCLYPLLVFAVNDRICLQQTVSRGRHTQPGRMVAADALPAFLADVCNAQHRPLRAVMPLRAACLPWDARRYRTCSLRSGWSGRVMRASMATQHGKLRTRWQLLTLA